MHDDDDEPRGSRHSRAELRVMRVRAECLSPARRRAMMCCSCFWIVVTLVLLAAGHSVVGTVLQRQSAAQIRASGGEAAHRCDQLGDQHCSVPHGPATYFRDGQCAPGHTWITAAHGRTPGVRGACVRRHWYPRAFDESLSDASSPPCTDVYTHACGAWDAWFDDQHPVVRANNYQANMGAMIDASLTDPESMVFQFAVQWCRPLLGNIPLAARDTADEWLRVQQGAPFPLWIPTMQTHTLCVLGALNRLMPKWFYEEAIGLSAAKSAALRVRVIALADQRTECSRTSSLVGALGDMSIAEVTWVASDPPQDHNTVYAELGSAYGHAWTAAAALAPYTWLALGEGGQVMVRTALPRSRGEWLRRSHCERIAAVMFLEVLEDRYAAAVWRQNVRPVLTALELCTKLPMHLQVTMIERPAQVRASVVECIVGAKAADWHALVAVVASCNAGHRLRPDQPLLDAFVPHIQVRRGTETVVLRVTPAVFQPPLFSPELEMQSVAARLYWTLLRAAAPPDGGNDCLGEQERDQWALDSLEQCVPNLMDRQFWLELVQLQCGERCARHWITTLGQRQRFKRAFGCSAGVGH